MLNLSNFELIKLIISIVAILILFILYFVVKKKPKFIKILGIIGIIYSVFYIVWRMIFTLPAIKNIGFIFGVILLAFEVLGLWQTFMFRFFFSSSKKIKLNPDTKFDELPTIDVIISTYNEPVDILKRTVVGCKNIDYPKEKLNIYIGDDGKREEVKELTQNCKIHYITRDNNEHAKAGNINNVLEQAKGEFVLLLDADMIPNKNIIKAMLHYFEDSSTGFVQSPQVFYNLDPFQYNLKMGSKIPNEQDFFMRTIEEKRALYNAVLHVGTNALFRRSAIDKIGGIPTGSITEDMATGMLLQNAGYKSYFVKDALAIGLSVENLEDLIKQRDRWCRGNIQVIKKFNPLKMKGLNLIQKLVYVDGFLYWMFGLHKMVYIISPLLFLLFRLTLFVTNGFDLAMIYLPFFISSQLYFKAVTNRGRNVAWSHIYETSIAPHLSSSFLFEFLFNKKLKFNVTPKGTTTNRNTYRFRLAIPHFLLFGLSVTAIILNIGYVFNPSSEAFSSVVINLIWCIYNLLAIIVAIFLFTDRSRFRRTERIPTNLKAKALFTCCEKCDECDYCGNTVDISENGARIILKETCPYFTFKKGADIELRIENIGIIKGEIIRLTKVDNKYDVGISFKNIGFEEYSNINQYRFDLNNKYIQTPYINTDSDGLLEIIFKQLSKKA